MFGIAYGLGSITIRFILLPKGGQLALPLQNYICNSKNFLACIMRFKMFVHLSLHGSPATVLTSIMTISCIKLNKYGKCTSMTSISMLSLVPQIPYIENEHISGNSI